MSDNKSFNELKKQHEMLKSITEKMFYCSDLNELEMLSKKIKDGYEQFFEIDDELRPIAESTMNLYIDVLKHLRTTEQENK